MIKNTAILYPPEQLMSMCNSPENLAAFLRSNLGYWYDRLLSGASLDHIFLMFEEVCALRTDDSNPERTNTVLSVSPVFYSFLFNKYLDQSEEADTYLKKLGLLSSPMNLDDVIYYMNTAVIMSYKNKAKQVTLDAPSYEWYEPSSLDVTTPRALAQRRLFDPAAFTTYSDSHNQYPEYVRRIREWDMPTPIDSEDSF